MFLDIHSHLDEYSDEELHGILHRGIEVGVTGVVSAGTDLRSSARCVYLSSRFDGVFAGIGVHPMKIQAPLGESHFASLREMALSTDKVLMVSEVGLDFLDGMPDKAWQYDAFRNQIRLARELRLPIVFHSRESHSEVLRLLREERAYEVGGAMHYFQADLRIASEAIDLGFYISIARPFLRLPWLQKWLHHFLSILLCWKRTPPRSHSRKSLRIGLNLAM